MIASPRKDPYFAGARLEAMQKLHDRWFRMLGIPLLSFFGDWIFYDEINRQHGQSFWLDYLISLIEVSLLWTLVRVVIIKARKRYPDLKQTRQRILYQAGWFLVITGIYRVCTSLLYDVTFFWGYHYTPLRYVYNIAVGFFCALPVAAIYEGIYLYRQWMVTYFEAEELKKRNLQTQLESLKEQVKPHFLFNCLNTLQALVIEEEKQRTLDFITDLAQVYRYLLQSNHQSLISLHKELEFIRAFVELLQHRFESGFRLEIDIPEHYLDHQLPPLTLQILVENAVKHNRISVAHPLTIKLYSDSTGNLVVVNNRQPKRTRVASNGTGLANISAKYRLLNQSDIIIYESNTHFQVSIPLLKPVLL